MRHALQISRGRTGAAYDARLDLRIGGTPVVLETQAQLIERLTRSAAPWSAFLDAKPEEAALLFERLCATEVTALERILGATVIVEELRITEPRRPADGGDPPISLRVGLDDGDYAVRLDIASPLWRERIGALLFPATTGAGAVEAIVALGPIEEAAEALAAAEVGDVVVIAGAGETLRAVAWTPTHFAPVRLGVDMLALQQAFAPRPESDPGSYVEIGRLSCNRSVAPGVEVAFSPYDGDRARYMAAGRMRAIGRLVNAGGDLGFAIEEIAAG